MGSLKFINRIFALFLLTGMAVTSQAQRLFFNFQNLPAGALPGGFLTLEQSGVTVDFSGNGTTISVNDSGQHVLHTAAFIGQVGMQFSKPTREVTFSLDPAIPALRIAGYYDSVGTIRPTTSPAPTGSTLVYSRSFDIWGLLLENGQGGFALSEVSFVPVPEPATTSYLLFSAAGLVAFRKRFKAV